MRSLDIAIAGAGPAGLASALFMARAGHRVEILERFDRPSPVGSGLLMQPTGLTVLHALGLSEAIHGLGSRIDRLHGADALSGRTVLDVRYDALAGGRYGLAVHRAALFNTLHDAVTHDAVPVRTGITLNSVRQTLDKALLFDEAGHEVGAYDLVLDCTGARSALVAGSAVAPAVRDLEYGAFWATLTGDCIAYDRHALSQRYDKAKVMIGLLPVGSDVLGGAERVAFFWSLKTAEAEAVRQAGLNVWKGRIAGYWPECQPLLDQIGDWDQLTLARYTHRTVRPPHDGRLVFIGDSAHSTSPQLGQGANMALLDAAVFAHALANAPTIDAALDAYGASRARHVRVFQLLSLLFTPFYQSDSAAIAWVRDRLVATLSRVPPVPGLLASIVSGTLIDPFSGTGLAECDWKSLMPDQRSSIHV
ncbi:FAD-dependent oxidoreductase [Pararhizobium sp.]|uniref:FAD-dependent oxidoreductase n=1 Tax=Pararhizobium sp. TaxID=1977563 RepID=UPI0027258C60|nr:NAD(P)/FAD-dependent oxidoreductase [Pararhizobium sp.]MDO9418766.1 NAD(P)/FAD-dependent oxidoreductase [Pararhizobium sp.]